MNVSRLHPAATSSFIATAGRGACALTRRRVQCPLLITWIGRSERCCLRLLLLHMDAYGGEALVYVLDDRSGHRAVRRRLLVLAALVEQITKGPHWIR